MIFFFIIIFIITKFGFNYNFTSITSFFKRNWLFITSVFFILKKIYFFFLDQFNHSFLFFFNHLKKRIDFILNQSTEVTKSVKVASDSSERLIEEVSKFNEILFLFFSLFLIVYILFGIWDRWLLFKRFRNDLNNNSIPTTIRPKSNSSRWVYFRSNLHFFIRRLPFKSVRRTFIFIYKKIRKLFFFFRKKK